MFYFSLIIGACLAGIGIGGGSLFVLLNDVFKVCSHLESMVYNLIMFIFVGISATFSNIKNKKFDKKIFFKLVIFSVIFAIIGVFVSQKVEERNLKLYFNIFILIIGIYEIISSLNNLKKQKI